jgi:hypothetical protein
MLSGEAGALSNTQQNSSFGTIVFDKDQEMINEINKTEELEKLDKSIVGFDKN